KKVILGIDDSPVQKAQKRVLTWQDKLFQLRPTFMDAEVDLKEDFDGISELDNPAPPWFMWLFYSTVLFAVVYFVNFTWTRRGPNQEQEYQASMVQHASSKNAFTKKAGESVDENSVTVETDQAKLTEAADIFKSKCAACHGADGGGMQGSGPNLADDYWIHGNSIKDVFKTIKYGYLSAGMVAWDGQISPPKMKALSTYVLSLRGTKPSNPQPPKGDKMDPKEKL
ncbi:MAG: c-type cytochrome, partial [Bacteroidia bacterium]|nr:c-type cytochrome [Bacteroidia bacterium]